MVETGLLQLLEMMMNSCFMFVHHLVYHLDLNQMETHKVGMLSSTAFSALALGNSQVYQQVWEVV